jgi:uncharacterized protein (DUF983 family)
MRDTSGSSSSSSGIGFLGLLTILFIALKLTHYIDWSWWYVLAPIWFPFALVVGVMIIVGLGVVLAALFNMLYKMTHPPKKR